MNDEFNRISKAWKAYENEGGEFIDTDVKWLLQEIERLYLKEINFNLMEKDIVEREQRIAREKVRIVINDMLIPNVYKGDDTKVTSKMLCDKVREVLGTTRDDLMKIMTNEPDSWAKTLGYVE